MASSAQDASPSDSFALRRAYLKDLGLDRHTIQKNRLRESDGLSEEAWWTVVKQVLRRRNLNRRKS